MSPALTCVPEGQCPSLGLCCPSGQADGSEDKADTCAGALSQPWRPSLSTAPGAPPQTPGLSEPRLLGPPAGPFQRQEAEALARTASHHSCKGKSLRQREDTWLAQAPLVGRSVHTTPLPQVPPSHLYPEAGLG